MKNITVYEVDKSEISERIVPWDEESVDSYYAAIYSNLNCDASEHIEISKVTNNPFGEKIRSGKLHIKTDSNKYNIDSIYYGSVIDKRQRNQRYLYKENFDKCLEQKTVNINNEIKEFKFGNLTIDPSESELFFDTLFWRALEQSHFNLKMIFHICDNFGVKYFSDFYGNGKNNAKSFAKCYRAFKEKKNIFGELTQTQKEILDILKNDCFDIDKNIIRYKKREMWSLF